MPLVCYQRALGMAETTQLPADEGICSSTNSPPKLAGLQLFAAKLNLARLREPCGQYDSSAENGTKPMSYTAMPSITSPIRLAKWNRAVHLTEAKGSSIFQQYKSGLTVLAAMVPHLFVTAAAAAIVPQLFATAAAALQHEQ